MRVFVVDGNIGAGKSALMTELEKRGFATYQENVSSWIPFLEELYKNAPGGSNTDLLQIRVLADQANIMRDIDELRLNPKTTDQTIVFVERWMTSAREVFIRHAEMCESTSVVTAHGKRLWEDLVHLLGVNDFHIEGYVYMRTPVDTALSRIQKRSQHRPSEKSIPREYVSQLNTLYESFVRKLEDDADTKLISLQNDEHACISALADDVVRIICKPTSP